MLLYKKFQFIDNEPQINTIKLVNTNNMSQMYENNHFFVGSCVLCA
jgi:hypothetical protein